MYLLLLYFLNPQQILRRTEILTGFECDHRDLYAAYHAQNNLFSLHLVNTLVSTLLKKCLISCSLLLTPKSKNCNWKENRITLNSISIIIKLWWRAEQVLHMYFWVWECICIYERKMYVCVSRNVCVCERVEMYVCERRMYVCVCAYRNVCMWKENVCVWE